MTEGKLPIGWASVELGDLIPKPRPKVPPDPTSGLPFIGMDHIEPNSFHLVGQSQYSEMKSAGSYFKPGDVLYGRLRPYLNKVHLAKFEGVASAEFIVLPQSNFVDGQFIKYLLHQRVFVDHAMSRSSGDRPRVKFDGLADFQFPLPPLNEQHRIVEKIETLFARIDKGEEALREVQKLLKRYRQSILKAAVTGTLIDRDWRDLKQVPLGDLLLDIRYGTAKKCGRDASQTPVLRIPNVVSGEINLSDIKYTELSQKEHEKLSLERGDILLVRSNGSANLVARGAIVDEKAVGYAYAGYLIRLRIDQARITPQFLMLVLDSPQMRSVIELQARSTSGVHNINSSEIRNLSIPAPSLDEQMTVVTEVERLFADIESLALVVEAELSRSSALRQSILKSAFTGQLVPQDPNDEPASELLARIRTERVVPPKKKAGKKSEARA